LLAAFAQITTVQPAWTQIHKWRYALSHPAVESGESALWDAQMRLGVCGDWLADGRIEGAWLSGQTCAKGVIQTG
jgi:predicted NAD/FAD-dependent oxidoreductase